MPVTDVQHSLPECTLTITAEFAAPVQRLWEVYADPRQLERIWGPPTHPATFVEHSLTPGTRSTYFMTGPEGDKFYGVWEITAVDEPRSFSYLDSFAHEDFSVNTDLPTSQNEVHLSSIDGGTRVVYLGRYPDAEGLQQVLDMGVVEGATYAINQIDDLLAG